MRPVDREHIVAVAAKHMDNLRRWLERPNGSFTADRVTLEAVEGGGILVRTQPYGRGRDVCVEAERELWGQRAALLSASTMGEAFDRLEELVAAEKRVATLEKALACAECGAQGQESCVVKGTTQVRSRHMSRIIVDEEDEV